MISPGLRSNFKASQFLSSQQASRASNRSKATRNLRPSALRGLSVRQGGSETVQLWDHPDTQVTKKVEAGIPGWQGALWESAKFLDFSCFFKQPISIKNAIFKKKQPHSLMWKCSITYYCQDRQLVPWATGPWTTPCSGRSSTRRGGGHRAQHHWGPGAPGWPQQAVTCWFTGCELG